MKTPRTPAAPRPSTPPKGSPSKRCKLLTLAACVALAAFTYGCGSDNPGPPINAANTSVTVRPSASPTPESDVERQIDREVSRLSKGVAGFEAPTSMRVGDVRSVVLILSPKEGTEEEVNRSLQQEVNRQANQRPDSNIAARTQIETAGVSFSRIMEARLEAVSRDDIEIKAITPQRQTVSQGRNTEWRWDVKALRQGPQQLNLVMVALLKVNDKEENYPLPVLTKVIAVDATPVPWTARVGAFLEKNPWVYTAVLIPLVVWLVKSRMDKKKEKEKRRDEAGGDERGK